MMKYDFEQIKKDCLGPDSSPVMKDSYERRGPEKVCMPYRKGGNVRSRHDIGGNVGQNNIDPTNNQNAQNTGQQSPQQAPQQTPQQAPQQNQAQPSVNMNSGTNNMNYTIPLKKGGELRDRRAIGGVGKVRKGQY